VKRMISDITLWLYFINFMLCLSAFGAFVWYWKSKGQGGELYKMITYLFGVNTIERGVEMYVRTQRHLDHEFYDNIISSNFWWFREVLVATVLAIMVYKIYKRIITNKK
jgi:hypothetical protein